MRSINISGTLIKIVIFPLKVEMNEHKTSKQKQGESWSVDMTKTLIGCSGLLPENSKMSIGFQTNKKGNKFIN